MRFNLKDLNPGTVFLFNDDKPEEGSVTLRLCNGQALTDIRKQTVKKRYEYKRGARMEVEDFNDELHSELLWDYAIVDWSGVEDEKGKPIPCTRENKALLMRGSPVFSRLVGNYLDRLGEEEAAHAEAVEKN